MRHKPPKNPYWSPSQQVSASEDDLRVSLRRIYDQCTRGGDTVEAIHGEWFTQKTLRTTRQNPTH